MFRTYPRACGSFAEVQTRCQEVTDRGYHFYATRSRNAWSRSGGCFEQMTQRCRDLLKQARGVGSRERIARGCAGLFAEIGARGEHHSPGDAAGGGAPQESRAQSDGRSGGAVECAGARGGFGGVCAESAAQQQISDGIGAQSMEYG